MYVDSSVLFEQCVLFVFIVIDEVRVQPRLPIRLFASNFCRCVIVIGFACERLQPIPIHHQWRDSP